MLFWHVGNQLEGNSVSVTLNLGQLCLITIKGLGNHIGCVKYWELWSANTKKRLPCIIPFSLQDWRVVTTTHLSILLYCRLHGGDLPCIHSWRTDVQRSLAFSVWPKSWAFVFELIDTGNTSVPTHCMVANLFCDLSCMLSCCKHVRMTCV